MQTETASKQRTSWPAWSNFLRRYGLENLAAWVLEAAGPLNVLSAQALYIGSPLLRPAFNDGQVEALAGMLEEREEVLAFASFLREELPS